MYIKQITLPYQLNEHFRLLRVKCHKWHFVGQLHNERRYGQSEKTTKK